MLLFPEPELENFRAQIFFRSFSFFNLITFLCLIVLDCETVRNLVCLGGKSSDITFKAGKYLMAF